MTITAEIPWSGLAIAVIGLLLGGFGGYCIWTGLSFWRRAKHVPGVVTDLHAGKEVHIGGVNLRVNGQGLWYPVVQFTTHDGREVETTARTGAQPMPARPGDEVTVLYDPADPTVSELTIGYRLSLGFSFLILGLIPLLLSIPGLLHTSLGGRLFMAGIFSGVGLPFALFGSTTLWMALRVNRIGYSILGGLFLSIGVLLLGIFGFVLFAFGG